MMALFFRSCSTCITKEKITRSPPSKREEEKKKNGNNLNILKNYQDLKVYLTGKLIQKKTKNSGTTISTRNLNEEMKVFGLIIMGRIPILLVLITCTCNGVRLM